MATTEQKSVAVIGAGLAGLSAARTLQQVGWQVSVFEASDRVGGRAASVYQDGYIIDTGASALADSYQAYLDLAAELGIQDRIIATSPVIEIIRDSRRHALDTSRLLQSALTNRLLSWPSKLRVLRLMFEVFWAQLTGKLDYTDLSKAAPLDTESAKDYADRALCPELLEYFCEPLVRVMLIANADQISRVELFSAVANIFSSKLRALSGGVGSLPALIAEDLNVQLNTEVTSVQQQNGKVSLGWLNSNEHTSKQHNQALQELREFDACVISCPLSTAAKIAPAHNPILVKAASKIDYSMTLTVSLGFRVRPNSDAFVIPLSPGESKELALLFLDHNKCPDRCPKDRYLINVHWEALESSAHIDADDELIIEKTLEQVIAFFPELQGQVEMTHVARWRQALPFTVPGTYKLIRQINESIDPQSMIQYAGDYLSAAGQNTAIITGQRAARRILGKVM